MANENVSLQQKAAEVIFPSVIPEDIHKQANALENVWNVLGQHPNNWPHNYQLMLLQADYNFWSKHLPQLPDDQ
jgi:hypothetical protein